MEIGEFSYGKKKLQLSWPHVQSKKSVKTADPHTVVVEDVPSELHDLLELMMETPKLGGGTIESFTPSTDQNVVVKFVDIEGKSVVKFVCKTTYCNVS